MQMCSKWRIDTSNALIPGLLRAVEYFAIGFVERVVGDVPFGGGDTGRPGALVDGVAGEVFHELHGWVGACFGVPVAGVDVGRVGGIGHFLGRWIGDGVFLGGM